MSISGYIHIYMLLLHWLSYVNNIRIKIPYPLQWGAPTFDAGHAFGMMAAVLVSLIEVLTSKELDRK